MWRFESFIKSHWVMLSALWLLLWLGLNGVDAWLTFENNHILKQRNALFGELKHEHADILKRCGG